MGENHLDPPFHDGRVRIERAFLGTLRRSGLSDGEAALLIRDAYLGSGTARREIGIRAGGLLCFTIPTPLNDGLTPDSDWSDQPVAFATVALGPGMGWRAGVLYDARNSIPATVASAAIGRPVGDVITHPDIDPGLIVQPDDSGGALRVRQEVIAVPLPRSPAARIRTWGLRLARRRLEGSPTPSVRRIITGCAMVSVLGLIINPPRFDVSTMRTITGLLSVLPAVLLLTMCIDMQIGGYIADRVQRLRRKGRSTTFNNIAHSRHLDELDEIHHERGFDERGRVVR
jgi:hypothetical protein